MKSTAAFLLLMLAVCNCQNNLQCSEANSLRLVGGSTQLEGRVEVCQSGSWGTVCDDLWGVEDASVVCAQLGYRREGAVALSRATFGIGSGEIYLDDVQCVGTETGLVDCPHSAEHNCGHREDAGVRCLEDVCLEGAIRLVDGTTPNEGRVEVCQNAVWGTVCDDFWDVTDAAVVCAQLGYSPSGAQALQRARFGRGTGSIFLDDVACTGSEARLVDCPHDPNTGDCSHFEDASVKCSAVACTTGDVRLVDGTTPNVGRVEVCLNAVWGTVCDDSWSTEDAQVACRQLGFSTNNVDHTVLIPPGSGPIHLDNLACSGSEGRLIDCVYDSHTDDCNHAEDAGVSCEATCSQGAVRIGEEGRVSAAEGRVEVCIDGQWGTVCDDRWDGLDAGVVCGQLGFSRFNAIAHTNARYGIVTDRPILLDEVFCTGTETRLLDCTHSSNHDCSHFEDAGVNCSSTLLCENGAVRLVGGASSLQGRVEMCWREEWGTVCDNGWSASDAAVVCSQLGLNSIGATAFSDAHFGQGSGDILLNNVDCSGTESSLIECSHSGIGAIGSCSHGDDAGVNCRPRVCSDGDVRLVNGLTEFEGRVEVCWREEWGTVCDDLWGEVDARVVCTQLGYNQTISVIGFQRAEFGRGIGEIWLDNVFCTGTEPALLQCPAQPIGQDNCGHGEDAGVRCSQCIENSVRLVGGASSYEGRVEVCLGGGWGTVCGDNWTPREAAVVCKQLGLPEQSAEVRLGAFFGRGEGLPILMDNVVCSSSHQLLTDCSYFDAHNLGVNCLANHSGDAGVICGIPPPGPPHSVILSSIDASSVTVSWQHPLNSTYQATVFYYTVNCTTDSQYSNASHVTGDNTTLSVAITELHPYTSYICCVGGVGMGGPGELSCQTLQTLQTAPTASPGGLRGNAASSVAMELSWTPPPPEHINGDLVEYRVRINTLDISQTVFHIVREPRIGLSGLHPYYRYECSVAAMTTALGPFSAPVTITTFQDVPSGPPRSIVGVANSSTSVGLIWLPPQPQHTNGIIIGYNISLTVASNGARQEYTTSQLTSYTVTSLQVYTRYIVTIAARTVNGTGPQSLGYEVLTSEAAPTRPPLNVRYTTSSSSMLELEWDLPARQFWNGIIRTRRVELTEVETTTMQLFNTSTNSLSLSGLHPYYNYRFRVAMVTIAAGPFSPALTLRMPQDAPSGPPRNVRVSVTTDLVSPSATIMWNSPPVEEQNGVITGYTVTLTNLDLDITNTHSASSAQFGLTNLEPNTLYTVTVRALTSEGGGPSSLITTFNTRTGVPTGPPQNLRVLDPILSSSLVFSWTSPPSHTHNGVIIGYTLTLTEQETGTTQTHNVTSVTMITVRDLHPYYQYVVAVAAYTVVGMGPFTEVITQRTGQDVPSGYPGSLRAVAVSPRQVQLSWSPPPPELTNGVITGYTVTVTGIESDESYTIDTVATQYSVTTLPYTSYMFSVSASTERGVGPPSPEVVIETPEEAPSHRPQNLTVDILGPTSFRLSWYPPPPQYHHGNIREYSVIVTEIRTGGELLLTSTTTEIVAMDLLPYTRYTCSVAAVTVAEGPYTAELVARTAEDAPSTAPVNVRITDRTSTTIRMEWEVPPTETRNGIVRRYDIRVSRSGASTERLLSSTSPLINIQGLIPDTQYQFQVAAFTVSQGPFSSNILATTLEDVPGSPPTHITLTKNSPTSITLSWSPPVVSNGDVVRYHAHLVECPTDTLMAVQTTETSVMYDNLHPYYTYKYSLTAATAVGVGPYSDNATVQLDEAAPSSPPVDLSVVSTTTTTAYITWAPPPLDSQNGIIRSYVIYLTGPGTNDNQQFTSSVESYSLTGLRPGNTYRVGVAAVTVETGPQSADVEIITMEDIPGTPNSFSVRGSTPRSISLSWTPPLEEQRNGVIIGYTLVVMQIIPITTNQPIRIETTELEFEVDGLHPAWMYEFSLAAKTNTGVGPSQTITATLPEDVPSAPPVDLTVTSPSPSTLRLSWGPPPSDLKNGIIREYQITITELATGTVTTDTTTALSYLKNGLRPYYTYECTVSAITVGEGPPAMIRVQQPQDAPGSPTELTINHTSSSTTLLRWAPVPAHLQNGIITGYIVLATSTSRNHSYSADGDTLELELMGLRGYTIYNFSVAAETTGGRGQPLVVTSRTPQGAPTVPPSNVMATRISATEVRVSWDPLPLTNDMGSPTETSFLVRYRVVEARRVTRNAMDTALFVEVVESDVVVDELEPHLVYGISVAAKNDMGVGDYSAEIITELFDGSLFRVHLYGPIVCLPWTSSGAAEKVNEVVHFLSSSLEISCDCIYSPKYIAQGSLQCGDQSTDRTILHATLVSSENATSVQIRDFLQTLVNTEPTILVQGVRLRVAPCSVLPDDLCPLYPALPIVTVAVEPRGGGGISVTLIGGIAGGLVFLICGTLMLILIVVGMKRRQVKRGERAGRRNQNLRLNFTLTPGEATNGVGYPSKLSKEQESGFDDDHIYDEPSKYFTDNLSGPPPSYNKPDTNFDQKMLSDLDVNPSPPRTTRGALPAPPIGNGKCKSIDNKGAFAEPEYDELGVTPKQDAIPGQPDYSELDVNKMPSLRYGNIGVSDVVPNSYEYLTSAMSKATPTLTSAEPPEYSNTQLPVTNDNTARTYEPLIPAPWKPKDTPPPNMDYQQLGPPVGYAVPQTRADVSTTTRSDVPQPSLRREQPTTNLELLEPYIEMKTPTY